MLNKKDFQGMRKEYDVLDKKREEVIQTSREVIKISKLIIYALHRDEISRATSYVTKIKKHLEQLKKIKDGNIDTGIYKVAFQEYAEALLFYHYMKDKIIVSASDLNVDSESYLLGMCDLSGELMRKAVNYSIKKKEEVAAIKTLVSDIYGEFLEFNLRNSELRKKSEQIKWNLAKLEDLMLGIRSSHK